MNKLERFLIGAAIFSIVAILCWYFRSVLVYVVISAVVAMVGRPIVQFISGIKIKGFSIPTWLSAIFTITLIFGTLLSMSLLLSPLVSEISSALSNINTENITVKSVLDPVNNFLYMVLPSLSESGFRIEGVLLDKAKEVVTLGNVSGVLSSVANILANLFVAIFSICFISFFFLKNEGTFTNILVAALPDRYEEKIRRSSRSISTLLSRYFLGILIESFCIALINGIGLIFIVKMTPSFAIFLACLSGVLNVIPYVGPLIGHVLALFSGLLVYSSSGFGGSLLLFEGVILAIFFTTQLIDNYLFQPLIYSNSVKAHPLEIFIVILMAAHIGGMVGMLVAIPTYTVIRVVAGEFLPNLKFVQELTKGLKNYE